MVKKKMQGWQNILRDAVAPLYIGSAIMRIELGTADTGRYASQKKK